MRWFNLLIGNQNERLYDGQTYEEVGRKYKLTRERIRQIETRALIKMRHPERIHKLEGLCASF